MYIYVYLNLHMDVCPLDTWYSSPTTTKHSSPAFVGAWGLGGKAQPFITGDAWLSLIQKLWII